VTPRLRLLLTSAIAVHVWLVVSVVLQPLDSGTSHLRQRFPTARFYFDAVTWPGPGSDFFALYHAGVQARRGAPLLAEESPRVTPYYFRYIYSPVLARTLGRLITSWPPRIAYLLWAGVIELTLVACLIVLWSGPAPHSPKVIATALLLFSQPYVLEVHMGQFTFVATALTLIAASCVNRGTIKASACGAGFLAVAGLLKTFPFVAAPAFARRRTGWPAVVAAVLCAAAVEAWIVIGEKNVGQHFATMALADSIGGPHPGAFSLLQGALTVIWAFNGLWLPQAIPVLPSVVLAGTLALVAVMVLRAGCSDIVMGSSVLVLAFFVAFLHVWEHHYSAVLLTGAFLLVAIAPSENGRWERSVWTLVAALAVLAAPSAFVLVSPDPKGWTGASWVLLSLSKAVPAAVVLAIGVGHLRACRVHASHSSAAATKWTEPSNTVPPAR
jgi:hypothetical protein